jgi:hypothetical protein
VAGELLKFGAGVLLGYHLGRAELEIKWSQAPSSWVGDCWRISRVAMENGAYLVEELHLDGSTVARF